MKSKKDIKREYKERPKQGGVFQIKNTQNGKVFLGSSLNPEGFLNRQKFQLKLGQHKNKALQKDWKEFGEENFLFEILEVLEDKDEPGFNFDDELTLLEQIWLEKLQPFGKKGYNTAS